MQWERQKEGSNQLGNFDCDISHPPPPLLLPSSLYSVRPSDRPSVFVLSTVSAAAAADADAVRGGRGTFRIKKSTSSLSAHLVVIIIHTVDRLSFSFSFHLTEEWKKETGRGGMRPSDFQPIPQPRFSQNNSFIIWFQYFCISNNVRGKMASNWLFSDQWKKGKEGHKMSIVNLHMTITIITSWLEDVSVVQKRTKGVGGVELNWEREKMITKEKTNDRNFGGGQASTASVNLFPTLQTTINEFSE